MIFHDYWVWIWFGILLLGILGFVPAVHWGRRTHWRNLDELLRGAGTIAVSLGMILLLRDLLAPLAYAFLLVALGCFIAAFVVGRRHDESRED